MERRRKNWGRKLQKKSIERSKPKVFEKICKEAIIA
jgi:hypothetical protein